MTTSTGREAIIESGVESHVLREGYGPGAWHGPDLKGALADVSSAVAFWRPAAGRHNIAEIALHHAYTTRAVRTQITGQPAEPFVIAGEDWFNVSNEQQLAWSDIRATLEAEQQRLIEVIAAVKAGRIRSPLSDSDRFGLVLGITCHAVYHAGQVQLIKRLHAA